MILATPRGRSAEAGDDMRTNDPNEPRREKRQGKGNPVPAVPVAPSVTQTVVYCLEVGRPFRSSTGNLRAKYAMTPDGQSVLYGNSCEVPFTIGVRRTHNKTHKYKYPQSRLVIDNT